MIFEKGYLFPPSFLEILETFKKAADRDSLSMAIHRYMYRGEIPDFKSMDLKRTWLGIFPYLKKSRNSALAKDGEQSQEEVGTNSRQSQEEVETTSGQSRDIKANGKGIRQKAFNKGEGEPPIIPQGIAAPSFEEVQEFARTEKIRTNTRKFWDYYSARSWRTNGVPVHDWKALLRVWASRDKAEEKPEPERVERPPFKACPVCGKDKVDQRGDMALCLSCDRSFYWTGRIWKEEK